MLDKLCLPAMDSNASQRLVSIVREMESISITYSGGQRVEVMTLTTSYRYAPRVMDGFITTPPNRERVDGLLPVTV